jgi:hypothetical protein
MKKVILSLALAILCLILLLYFIVFKSGTYSLEIVVVPYLIVVFVFGLYMGVSRLLSLRKSEPIDDEMSKKIKMKAASYSYYISLYMWMFMIFFLKDKINLDKDELIGFGIVCMSFIFIVTWSILKMKGIKSE